MAGIGHGYGDEVAGYRLKLPWSGVLLENGRLNREEQVAAARHGITGIDAEVHQNLMQLSRVAENSRQACFDFEFDADRAGKDALKEPCYFGNIGVNLELCFEATRASRKPENAANHFRATLSRASQDGEHLHSIRFRKVRCEHLRGHKYGREYVVEGEQDYPTRIR